MPALDWDFGSEFRATMPKIKIVLKGLSEFEEALEELEEAFGALVKTSEGDEDKKFWKGYTPDDETYYSWFTIGEHYMPAKKSPFRKGRAKTSSGAGGSQFLSIKDGESFTFAPLVGLDEMVSADMHEYWDIRPAIYHPCIGRGCPGCEVGNDPRFKGYLPVGMRSGEIQVFPFTISVYNQLEQLEDSLDDDETLKGFVIKISRKGSGLSTRYTILGVGKRLEMDGKEAPDFIPQLGPQTSEEIWELLEENGFDRGDTHDVEPVTEAPADDKPEVSGDDEEWGDV